MSFDESLDIKHMLEQPENQMAAEISNRWMEWNGYRVEARSRWRETTAYVYATSTRNTTNEETGGLDPDNQDTWSHSTHIPKLTQVYDNLVANYKFALFPNGDWFKFVGDDFDSSVKDKRMAAEAYLKTKHSLNKFEPTMIKLLNDWVLYGNCFAQVTYEVHKNSSEEGEDVVAYAGPVVNRISPYDIVFNPLASSFEGSPKIIRKVMTMGEFMRKYEDEPDLEWDEDAVKMTEMFRAGAFKGNEDAIDKGIPLTIDGFGTYSSYLKSGYIEVITFYGDIWDHHNRTLLRNHEVSVIDRRWVLSKRSIPTWDGRAHIYHASWRDRPDNLWGMGPLDNLVGLQYKINHLENSKADALDQMIAPTRVIIGDVDEDEIEVGRPGGTYRIPSGEGSVANLAPDTTILQADFMNQFMMQLMEELSGSPREALGIRTPGEKTAFEVSQLSNAASRNFQSKIESFQEQFLEKIINAELELGRRYIDGAENIHVKDPISGLESFLEITKADLKLHGKLRAQGARHFARQNQLLQNIVQLQQAIATDPMVQQHFPSKQLAKMYEELLGVEEFGLYSEYGRIAEQAELQQMQQAAATATGTLPAGALDEE